MRLYFLRHGIAQDISETNGSDFARALTSKGVERLETSAQVMKNLGLKPAKIFSSPLVRARQTAEIVGKVIGVEVTVESKVGPGFSAQAVRALIADLGTGGDVMFVGHEPNMSEVVSALSGGGHVVMKKGSLARLDVYALQPLRCALVWLIAPAVFVEAAEDDD
jgi:phosphohistidine phosphatase